MHRGKQRDSFQLATAGVCDARASTIVRCAGREAESETCGREAGEQRGKRAQVVAVVAIVGGPTLRKVRVHRIGNESQGEGARRRTAVDL